MAEGTRLALFGCAVRSSRGGPGHGSGPVFDLFHWHHLDGIPGQFIAHLRADLATDTLLLADDDRRIRLTHAIDGR
jgi:hypothetical protein